MQKRISGSTNTVVCTVQSVASTHAFSISLRVGPTSASTDSGSSYKAAKENDPRKATNASSSCCCTQSSRLPCCPPAGLISLSIPESRHGRGGSCAPEPRRASSSPALTGRNWPKLLTFSIRFELPFFDSYGALWPRRG